MQKKNLLIVNVAEKVKKAGIFSLLNNCAFRKVIYFAKMVGKLDKKEFLDEICIKMVADDAENNELIATMTPGLPLLRTQAEIPREELANLIGVSRQTYSAIERKVRRMSWSTYLSLVLFFDHNKKTHKMLRMLHLFPQELITRFNDGVDYSNYAISSILGNQAEDLNNWTRKQNSQFTQ